MAVQPKVYDLAWSAVGEYFIESGCLTSDISNKQIAAKYDSCLMYDTTYSCNEVLVRLTVLLPKSFPDEFPKVFIDQLSYDKLLSAPHINWDRSICTYNNFTRPNPDYPVEVVQETINKAKEILKDIITGKDLTNEYLEEITHYWNLDVEGQIHSLLEPGETPYRIYLGKKAAGTSIVAAASIKEVQAWYGNLGVKPEDIEIKPGIYVPELDYGVPPFPKDNGQWVKTFSRNSQKLIKDINEIFKDCDWPVTLVFSETNSNLTTWEQLSLSVKP